MKTLALKMRASINRNDTITAKGAAAAALLKLLEGCDLPTALCQRAFKEILAGHAKGEIISGLLTALRMRCENANDLMNLIVALKHHQLKFRRIEARSIDIGGTGGDRAGTFNVSTTAAIVAAASGATVYKHGSSAVSSACGSMDLVRRLGILPAEDALTANRRAREIGITFLDSGTYLKYPAVLKRTRKALPYLTIFNLAGPWCNPAGVTRQVIGVAQERFLPIFEEVAHRLRRDYVLLVHGRNGSIDEFSPSGPSVISEVTVAGSKRYEVRPSDFGLPEGSAESIAGGEAEANARHSIAVLSGAERGPRRSVTLLTAGVSLYLSGIVASLEAGISRSADAIDSNLASKLLHRLRACSTRSA